MKKMTFILIVCLFILLSGCYHPPESNSDVTVNTLPYQPIKTHLECKSYYDDTEFIVSSVDGGDSPLRQYCVENNIGYRDEYFENDKAQQIHYVKIDEKDIELTYKGSMKNYDGFYDLYSSAEDSEIVFYFHMNTDILWRITKKEISESTDTYIDTVIPIESIKLDSEEAVKLHSQNMAKIFNYDLTGLVFSMTTYIETAETEMNIAGFYIPKEGEKLKRITVKWEKVFTEEFSSAAFTTVWVPDQNKMRLKTVTFSPYPNEFFNLSVDEIKDMILSPEKEGHFSEPKMSIILNNIPSILVRVDYKTSSGSDRSDLVIILPAKVTFPY